MLLSKQFQDLLQASAEGFEWAVLQVTNARRSLPPPKGLGEWTVTRHIFHMMFYEIKFALPAMQLWLDDQAGVFLPGDMEENVAWSEGKKDVESLLARFRNVRAEQVALLSEMDDLVWNTTRQFYSGSVTLTWLVSKTYQHTAEHTNNVMRIPLFWDIFEGQQNSQ